jgi:Cft2 family RNA processing exonuclease
VTGPLPGEQLTRILAAAARVVLERLFPGQCIDVVEFARANRANLLDAISGSRQLREVVRAACPEAGVSHELLAALLGDDVAASATAAEKLAADPGALALPRTNAGSRTRTIDAPPAQSSTEAIRDRRASNAEKQLARTRKKLERDRGRLGYAESQRDEARRERDTAASDRDEALIVIESLRAELASTRVRETALAGNVQAAARLLASSLAPPQPTTTETDLREQDRSDNGAGTVALAVPSASIPRPAAPGAVFEAIAAAGLSSSVFLAVLDAIANPLAEVPEPVPVVFTRDRDISLTPLGGGTEIGGSCMLVEVGDVRILIDVGSRPRPANNNVGPPDITVATAGHIDAIVLTHAHNDHSGYVPALTSRYPYLPIYCTPDTAALLPTMWNDAVKVFERTQHERAAYGDPAAQPPYTQTEAIAAQYRIRELTYGRVVDVLDGVTIELFPAGHILGAAGVVITAGTSRAVVTGDVSDIAQASVPGLIVPDSARGADLLVIESTYCRPGGKPRDQEVERFVSTVAETVRTGRVLVPAFALGRAQEVVLTLRDRLPDVPILVDGMAKEISRIYQTQTAGTERPLQIYGDNVKEVLPASRREQNIAMRRGVIVTTSGMLSAGPAIQWARWILPDPSSALLVSGYQDEESPGRALLDLVKGDGLMFNLDGQDIEVKANVAEFRLSAHAGRNGLTSIIGDIAPRQTMLVHGVASAQREFADHLHRNGFSTVGTARWQRAHLGPILPN